MKNKIVNRLLVGLVVVVPSLLSLFITSCKSEKSNVAADQKGEAPITADPTFFDLSLAQWSLNKTYAAGDLDPMDFAQTAKDMGINAVEYVAGLYSDKYEDATDPAAAVAELAGQLKTRAEAAGVQSLLIMIDGQGDLAVQDETSRLDAVEQHKKWVDAAQTMGCHSIRVNLFGDGSAEEMQEASIASLRLLGAYAATKRINVLVENHGGFSSDPDWLVGVMEGVGLENVGTLPDFGNFCIEREGGARWDAPCINMYPDKVAGVKYMMPYAKAVSAKSYVFNDKGEQDEVDYFAMMKMLKESGYTGYIGIEYEGGGDEEKGILMTRDLMAKAAKAI